MKARTIRQALLTREVTFGTRVQIGHGAVSEALADCGLDWIAADCEHTDIDVHGFTELARGMHGRGAAPLARARCGARLTRRSLQDTSGGRHGSGGFLRCDRRR